jgi:hypothetical protein
VLVIVFGPGGFGFGEMGRGGTVVDLGADLAICSKCESKEDTGF